MSLSMLGYVLEPPRVGGSNSAYTLTPNNLITDASAFSGHFPSGSEPVPRAEYLVLVQEDGRLADATFGWTKNEVIQRFGYSGQDQRFKPLCGAPLEVVGVLGPDANSNRIKVLAPVASLSAAPFRVSVGTGVGQPFTANLVTAFGSPAPGVVEILSTTGELNWNVGDLSLYDGLDVRFQRQQFYTEKESSGNIGTVESLSLLNPLPAYAQYPLLRIGFRSWLQPIARPNDASLSPSAAIPAGSFEWSATSGLVVLSAVDVAAYPGRAVYYDGVLCGWSLQLPRQSLGTVYVPGIITGLPAEGCDLIFRLSSGYQFASYKRVTSFSSKGKAGVVEVKSSGEVRFSVSDRARYGSESVEVVFGDLPVEWGVALRLFRSPVNLTGSGTTKDISALYLADNATLADPIVGAPQVYLPAVPYEGSPLTVRVEQGTGSYVGILPRLDVALPPAGIGYLLDFEGRQLVYAQRKAGQLVEMPEESAAVALPDPLVQRVNLTLEREISPGTGVFAPLVLGQDALLDAASGVVTYTSSHSQTLASGAATTFSGTVLTDLAQDFMAAGVAEGDYLLLSSGVYRVASVLPTTLTTYETGPAATGVVYEIRRGAEVVLDRYWQEVRPLDPVTRVERVRGLGPAQNATTVATYSGLAFPGALVATTPGDFLADGVSPGDTLRLTTGPDTGSSRRVTSVQAQELEVLTAFSSFSAADGEVLRWLSIDPAAIGSVRIRLGSTFATVVVVPDDNSFSVALPSGTVEVSQVTGNLHFSAADLGVTVATVSLLTNGEDYRLNAGLGLIDFTERFLTNEGALLTYRTYDQETGQPGPIIEEQGAFLVRKEVTQPYPRAGVTNQVQFNPLGKTVAATPSPQVFRGGRPQSESQAAVDLAHSTVTFLPNQGFMTDALPSGSQLQPDERVYVDYWIYEAMGGEKTLSVLQPPMVTLTVQITATSNQFSMIGDQTGLFPVGHLLRINTEAVYAIVSVVYDAPSGMTTVTVSAPFNEDYLNPTLYVSSGVARTTGGAYPSYFQVEPAGYTPVPRGMNQVQVAGDKVRSYPQGTLLLFSGTGFNHYYEVTGTSLDERGVTVITLAANVLQEYRMPSVALRRSVRPIVAAGATSAQTSQIPVLSEGYLVFRQVEGSPGAVTQDKLDESGVIKFAPALNPNESLAVFYHGYQMVPAGTQLRASYTTIIAPNSQNGLENQVLRMDYTVLSPDTFFYRVETLTNFLSEVTQELEMEAKGSSPTAGPTTSNSSQSQLFEEGRESVYFEEGHLANVDLVCRALLRFYNDAVHHLEDHLESVDGRVVGEADGRFRFDGETDNPVRTSYATVTNEIDDRIQTYTGKTVPLYTASVYSRLYPRIRKTLFGETTAGVDTGDPILDWAQTDLDSLPAVAFRRYPRSLTVRDAQTGDTTLYVDNAQGTTDLLRPAFINGMKVRITARDGTVLVPDGTPLTVSSVAGSPEQILLSALPVDVPAGSTVFLSTEDDVYQKSYRIGTDVGMNKDEGLLTFIKPYFPFDGSLSPLPVPDQLCIQPPGSGEYLQMNDAGIFNRDKAPRRFPALDGVSTTDTGDQGLPIQSPNPEQERLSLEVETESLSWLSLNISPSVVLNSVSVNAAGTVLTYGAFPAPVPKVWDLIRFTTGPNASAGYRRISNVNLGLGTVTVDVPFPVGSSSGSAIITATVDVATGTATFPSSTILDDPTLSVAVQVGHTIVITSGANIGSRRQVVALLSGTQVQFTPALSVYPVPGATYRVSNHISTYSVLPTATVDRSLRVVGTNDRLVAAEADSQILAIERFYDGDSQTQGVLTDLVPTSSGSVSGSTLTDSAADFVAAGVTGSHFVYVRSGTNRGFFQVSNVLGPTQLQVATPFPVSGPVTYRVVKAFGLGIDALTDTVALLFAADDYLAGLTSWQAVLLPVSVLMATDPGTAFATSLTSTALTGRQADVLSRVNFLDDPATGPASRIENVTGSRDKLYDTRFTWIDSRVNLESGTLYEINRAVDRRNENLAKTTNQLLRLLSLEALKA